MPHLVEYFVVREKRRRRDRFIAWGVSPRNKDAPSLEPWRGDSPRKMGIQFHSAPKGATDLWNGASTRDPKHLADAWPGVRGKAKEGPNLQKRQIQRLQIDRNLWPCEFIDKG